MTADVAYSFRSVRDELERAIADYLAISRGSHLYSDPEAHQAAEAKAWNTQQWLRFLAEPKFDAQTLEGIDQAYSLSRSGNCEILCAWLDAGIRANYAPAFATSETFLMTVGRRKYLKPLYEALLQSPGGRERALLIYQRARPRYHAVAVRTLDALLEVAPK
jgi:hypothetical protein